MEQLRIIEGRIKEISTYLTDSDKPLAPLLKAVEELESQKSALQQEIDDLRASKHSSDIAQYSSLCQMLASNEDEAERQKIRLKLQSMIPKLISSIEIIPKRNPNRRITCDATITYQSGLIKTLTFMRGDIVSPVGIIYPWDYTGEELEESVLGPFTEDWPLEELDELERERDRKEGRRK